MNEEDMNDKTDFYTQEVTSAVQSLAMLAKEQSKSITAIMKAEENGEEILDIILSISDRIKAVNSAYDVKVLTTSYMTLLMLIQKQLRMPSYLFQEMMDVVAKEVEIE